MKTLGLIGGTSWHSTQEYYKLINQLTEAQIGTPPINPPLYIHSLSIDLMRRQDWDEIQNYYMQVSEKLEEAGAQALIICANTPHKVIPFVQPEISIPFLHIADAIGKEAKSRGLKKLGLLGTDPVANEGFIKDRVTDQFEVEVIVPAGEGQELVHGIIVDELTQGIFRDETKEKLIQQMESLKSGGCDGIILGCTELPIILKKEDFDLAMLETTRLHAEMAVEFILS